MKLAICDNCPGVFNADVLDFEYNDIYTTPSAECPDCGCNLFKPEEDIADNSERIKQLEHRIANLETMLNTFLPSNQET